MPSRSAIIGMVGAALGIDRDAHEQQQELASAFGVGVRVDVAGNSTQDFHTTQSLSRLHVRRSGTRTRAAMMAHPDRGTMLSRRAYRTDALYTLMLWEERQSSWTLSDVQCALLTPVFALYAGRKANVLALPLRPELIDADSLAAAFLLRHPVPTSVLEALPRLRPRAGWGRRVAYDGHLSIPSGMPSGSHRTVRRDQPSDRRTWLFDERTVEFNELPEVVPS